VESRTRSTTGSQVDRIPSSWGEPEHSLNSTFNIHRESIHNHLMDDFNTPKALQDLLRIVSVTQVYMTSRGASTRRELLLSTSHYVRSMLEVFGLESVKGSHKTPSSAGGMMAQPPTDDKGDSVIDAFLRFRSNIRKAALKGEAASLKGGVLKLCDQVRNETFPSLGMTVEDQADGDFIWKRK
jgi:cysteinyl-tRNA synthetase